MTTKTTKAQAEALWETLNQTWGDHNKALEAIIARQAWKPVGYATLYEAWKARLSEMSFSRPALAAAVYQMHDEGVTPAQIAAAVRDVTVAGAKNLIRQKDNGTPASSASPFRGGKDRPRNPQTTIFVHVGAETFGHYEEIARLSDRTVTEISTKAVEQEFAKLEGELKRRSKSV